MNDFDDQRMTRLAIAKHCILTAVHAMHEDDYLAIVSFRDTANVNMPIVKMDKAGKARAERILAMIYSLGEETNVLSGIDAAAKLIKESTILQGKNVIVTLLGNTVLDTAITNRINSFSTLAPFSFFNIFIGFNPSFSKIGPQLFGLVSKASPIGTVFVDFLAYIRSIRFNQCAVKFECAEKGKIKQIVGWKDVSDFSDFFNIGPIQYGTNRHIVIKVAKGKQVQATICFDGQMENAESDPAEKENEEEAVSQIWDDYYQFAFLDLIRESYEKIFGMNGNEVFRRLMDFRNEIYRSNFAKNKKVSTIMKDIKSGELGEGEIGKAFEKVDNFNSWGFHRIPSIVTDFQFEISKDNNLLREIKQVFLSLPTPEATGKEYVCDYN